jgi:predicted unusual protein kinase regulating ubiquinone biosynthesis (AarF/ABC1/UbiB family)
MARKRSAVPSSRVGRLLRFGLLSGELTLNTALAGAMQLTTGKRPDLLSTVLTPRNADLLVRRLATLRGPAMKVGQMLSLQGEDILPAAFRQTLEMLRSQGFSMPDTQLKRVLGREFGKGWESRFAHFDTEPVAAASIGQVHRVTKVHGRELALKVQYPGVARSIDSDVDNLASLLKRFDFLPGGLDVQALAGEAKRQLRLEADYRLEARNLKRYRHLVSDMPELVVPRVDSSLSTQRVLATDWIEGESMEHLCGEAVAQARRNEVGHSLYRLLFRELFEFGFMQTDPNLANYLYLPADRRIALLDFGSVCTYSGEFTDRYRRIVRAVLAHDRAAIRDGAIEIGYAQPDDSNDMHDGVVDIIQLVCEPIAHRGSYDFSASQLASRARDLGLALAFGKGLRSPPPETIFLHRKLAGTFLACARLRARVNVHTLLEPFL